MARSLWIGALVGMLACNAPGRAQVVPYEHIVTVREPGRPAQKCRVLKVWTDKDGVKGCQVQEVNTREIMTIMDVGSASSSGGAKAPMSRIYHWGASQTPPAGVPAAPVNAILVGVAVPPVSLYPVKPASSPENTSIPTSPTSKTVQPVVYPEKAPAPVSPAAPTGSERIVTVKGPNGIPEQCRVLKEWWESDGSKHCQLQVVATGETMTMVEPRVSALKSNASSLFHWGSRDTSSQSVTTTSPGAVVTTTTTVTSPAPPTVTTVTSPAPPAVAPSNPRERVVTIKEANSPAQKCRVLKTWTEKDGCNALQIQVIETGEIMTMIEPRSSTIDGKTAVARFFHWKSSDQPPLGAPTIPPDAVVMGTPAPAPKPGLLSRLFGSSKTESTTVVTISQPAVPSAGTSPVSGTPPVTGTSPAAGTAPDQGVAKTATDPQQPKDWRQSWGKTERWSADDSSKAVAQSSSQADQTARPIPPLADKSVDDPLKKPQEYVKTLPPSTLPAPQPLTLPPAIGSGTTASGTTTSGTATTAPATLAPLPKPVIATQVDKVPPPRPSLWSMLTNRKTETDKVVEKTPPTPDAPKSNVPLGMGSVMAVNSPNLNRASKPIAQVTMVDGQPVVRPADAERIPGLVSVPVTAPNAFTLAVGTTPGSPVPMMMPPQMMPPGAMMPPASMMAQNVPPGMSNAFTNSGSTRPLPAEYGMVQQDQNAFEYSGMSPSPRRQMAAMPPAGYYPYPMPMMPMQPMPPRFMAQVQEPQTGPLIAVLHDSILPSERETAAEQLACYDGRSQPQVVSALVASAKDDPAPAVRASCVRSLAKMRINTVPVVQTVQALRNDQDIRVRQEVEQALQILSH